MTRARLFGLGLGGCLAALLVGAVALAASERGDQTCSTLDERVAVVQRDDGWTAEVRHQRHHDGYACHAVVQVALFSPGGSWEDEGLMAAAIHEHPVGSSFDSSVAPVRWSGDRLMIDSSDPLVFVVEEWPDEGTPGALRFE